jgi:hypothetical protein
MSQDGSNNYLPGYLVYESVKEVAPQFYQNFDINIAVTLLDNGATINYNDYVLKAVLKPSLESSLILWQGFDASGIFNNPTQIKIPKSITKFLQPGIYHLAVLGIKKSDSTHRTTLWESPISLNLGVGSLEPLPPIPVSTEETPRINIPIQYF